MLRVCARSAPGLATSLTSLRLRCSTAAAAAMPMPDEASSKDSSHANDASASAVDNAFHSLHPALRTALASAGITTPTSVQQHVMSEALVGRNVVATAETGSGKTAAFALPILHQLASRDAQHRGDSALVLVPTRELAMQVAESFEKLGERLRGVRVTVVCGGASQGAQMRRLANARRSKRAQVIVATPGRVLSLLQMGEEGCIPAHRIKMMAIDECDRMLDMGFLPDVHEVLSFLPDDGVQNLLFSATIPPQVHALVHKLAPDAHVADLNKSEAVPSRIEHIVHAVGNRRKTALLAYLLRRDGSLKNQQVLVFARTKMRADILAENLEDEGIGAVAVHGDLPLHKRQRGLAEFRNNRVQVLVATDVLGRGIDLPGLPCVVNLDVPMCPQDYVHRVGRTGRQGREGVAITFVGKESVLSIQRGDRTTELNEIHLLKRIQRHLGEDHRLQPRPVPGPWRDAAKRGDDAADDDTPKDSDFASTEDVSADLARHLMSNERPGRKHGGSRRGASHGTHRHGGAGGGPRVHRMERRHGERAARPGLRNFRQGRYEDVVRDFDTRRAEKRGYKPASRSSSRGDLHRSDRRSRRRGAASTDDHQSVNL